MSETAEASSGGEPKKVEETTTETDPNKLLNDPISQSEAELYQQNQQYIQFLEEEVLEFLCFLLMSLF